MSRKVVGCLVALSLLSGCTSHQDLPKPPSGRALESPAGKSLADEYDERMQKKVDEISKSLDNDVQRQAFRRSAQQIQQQMYRDLSNHTAAQQQVFQDETQKATIITAANHAVLLWSDGKVQEHSLAVIHSTIAKRAQLMGWGKETTEVALSEAVSPLHVGVIKAMIQAGVPAEAQKYYEENSASMTLQARDDIQGVLGGVVNAQRAKAAAWAAWLKLGPKGDNDVIRLFDMGESLRKPLRGWPAVLKLAIDDLHELAQIFVAQRNATRAQNIAGVWKQVDSGVSLNEVQRSKHWLALTATEQHDLRMQIEEDVRSK